MALGRARLGEMIAGAVGRTNRPIATALYLSEETIRAHMRSIMRKINAANRVQAATLALRRGLSSPVDDQSDISLGVGEQVDSNSYSAGLGRQSPSRFSQDLSTTDAGYQKLAGLALLRDSRGQVC